MLVAAASAAPFVPYLAAGHAYGYAAGYPYAGLHYAAPVAIQKQIHYAATPVVTGYSTQILKPAIGAAPLIAAPAVAAPVEVVAKSEVVAAPIAYAAPVAVSIPTAPVPAGDAPAWSELVQTEKIQAPVRTISKVTPEVTVQLPTKVNVEKVAVEVPVATPYAHPVPHPVPVAVPTPVHAAPFVAHF